MAAFGSASTDAGSERFAGQTKARSPSSAASFSSGSMRVPDSATLAPAA